MASFDFDRILELERRSRVLEPSLQERRTQLQTIDAYVQQWLEELPDLPPYGPDNATAINSLEWLPIPDEPRPLQDLLDVLDVAVDRIGVNESVGTFFGYIPGGGIYAGALADYHAAAINRYSGVYYGAPGAVRVGRACIEWLAGVLGYPAACGGDITSGGSIANLSAVVAAREAKGLHAPDFARSVIYLTTQTHHALDKAIRVSGLGEAPRRLVPLDDGYRMQPVALEQMIREDRDAGLVPFLTIASAGATNTGAVDPLSQIADVCERQSIWFHVDAAYGGAFAVTASGADKLKGIERSDSVVVDPHKGFFLPFGTGVVLVREKRRLVEAFSGSAAYLEHAMSDEPDTVLSPSEMSPELSRPFRALRWWMALQLAGVDAFRAALEEKLLLARYAYERVGELDGFEVGPAPDLSVFTFRHTANSDPDAFNRALVDALESDGRMLLSGTELDGRYTPRWAVLSPHTHLAHIDRALEVLVEVAEGLQV